MKGTGFSPYRFADKRSWALAPEVKGMGFSPYISAPKRRWALAPEVKGMGFSPYISTPKRRWALAPQGRWLLAATLTLVLSASAPAQTPTTPPPTATPAPPSGKVIFSRSLDENGQPTTQSALPETQPAPAPQAPVVEDADRQSVTVIAMDLDVHLRPAEQHIAVRALLTVRNDGSRPLDRIPLQISSTLNWERIRVLQRDVAFPVAILNSDSDHTGQLHEASVTLPQPLAPGDSIQLDATYSGLIVPNAQRLLAVGTPDNIALHSDWDQIGPAFTGLRGFGNVVWYPVSTVPVILGDGARLFDEIGRHKLRLTGVQFRLHLTVEFPHGHAPTIALINGRPAPLSVTNPTDLNQEVEGVATTSLAQTLGFESPSLFVAIRTAQPAANTALWVLPEDEAAVPAWSAAADAVSPFLASWLGPHPRSQLTLLDLPDPQDAPWEAGSLLLAPIRPAPAAQLNGILAHALTHAWVDSPRAWLSEGVASFMNTLWIEKTSGREKALQSLEAGRTALALAEPASPGESPGQPLAQAISPVYYRTKATYIFWMLREALGDDALSAALRAYDPAAETNLAPAGLNPAHDPAPTPFEKILEQAAPADSAPSPLWKGTARPTLSWLFSDWINADKGLPELAISGVFPTAEQAGNWLVTVNIANTGYAAAEVPVTVHSDTSTVTERVLVPARGTANPHLLLLGKPTQVEVNDGVTPETTATLHITRLDDSPTP